MDARYFVSYSRIDAAELALRLADELEAGPPPYSVWLDVRELQPGQQDWDRQLVEAIQTCTALVFVMTDDSVRDESGCKPEWVAALRYKKPIIPVRLHAGAELPFRLSSRQRIEFADSFEMGLAQLRKHLSWTGTPAGVLQDLRNRRADAEYELPRAQLADQRRIEQDLDELCQRIEEQQRVVTSPQAVAEQADARIKAAITVEQQPERPVATAPRATFVNRPPMTAPPYFQDRHVETGLIGEFLRADGLRVMSVVGRGGVGKTAMVCRLLKSLERGQLPDELGELAVDGIVYLSPLGAHPVDFAHVFADLCRLLPQDVAKPLLDRSRDPHETPAALTRALLDRFPAGRWVLLLDNFEDVVDAKGVGLTDSALDEALRTVLAAPEHGVKVIITTRFAPQNLQIVQPGVQRRLNLDEGLPSPFAEEIMRAMDPDGSLGIKAAPDALLAIARERTRGFPRALEALAGILAADRNTTLPELLAVTDKLPENVVEALVGEAFNRLDALAQQVMQALAMYPGPVPPVAVDYVLQPYQSAIDSAPLLGRLVNMQFVRRDAGRYYLHQVDRDYALQRVPPGELGDHDDDPPPFSQGALRERAADYFQQTRTPRETWRTLDDLAPQLAEFELRCQAGDYDTAAQVLLDISGEYLQPWGHVRLARDLHERLHGQLTDAWTNAANLVGLGNVYYGLGEFRRAIEVDEQALVIFQEVGYRGGEGAALNGLGNAYYGLGELRRAIEVHEQALVIVREIGDRGGEGDALGNLGDAYEALGELRRAIEVHEQALVIRREIGDRRGEGAALTGLGNAYYALGELRRAIEFYEQALVIFREIGDRRGEGTTLGNLGNAYDMLGELRRAIEVYERALVIRREIGDRGGEGNDLVNLGSSYFPLGELWRAIEFYEQALVIFREIGNRRGEGVDLVNLGDAYDALGELRRAIEFYGQALVIFREIGDRGGEALGLIYIAGAYADAGDWPQAIRCVELGVRIADEVGLAQASSEGRAFLAVAHLAAGEHDLARATAQAAQGYDYARMSDNLAVVLGIALAREGRVEEARHAFHDAVDAVGVLLAQTADAYDELDNRALALCGLALLEDSARVDEAIEAFRAARAVTRAEGIVARVLRMFDALATSDEAGILAPVRPAASGEA